MNRFYLLCIVVLVVAASVPARGQDGTTLASGVSSVSGIAVDGTSVYWTECFKLSSGKGAIKKVPINTGTVTTLATGLNAPLGIAVDSQYVYFSRNWDNPPGGISRISLTGGSPSELTPGCIPTWIDKDETSIYWAEGDPDYCGYTEIMSIPLAGGTEAVLAETAGKVMSVGTDDTSVYWVDSGDSTVKRVAKTGGTVTPLATGVDASFATIRVYGGEVYWNEYTSGAIKKVPANGGSVTTVASGLNLPVCPVVDDAYIYWAEGFSRKTVTPNGKIRAVSMAGGAIATIAQGLTNPFALTLDADNVYWSEDAKIKKTPKPGGAPLTVETPTISPAGGTFNNTVTVMLACITGGATIHFTTNGSDPTASSPVYSKAFTVTTTSTVKAQASKTGDTDSGIASAMFTIVNSMPTVATPTITPAGGTFSNSATVTLKCTTAGATIRYTTNGVPPTSSSPIYKTALTLTTSVTLQAAAFKTKMANSGVTSAAFTIIPPPPLVITAISLPDGKVKVNYPPGVKLQATGGVTPYKWSWAAQTGSKLPTGLALNATTGAITGKPTKVGTVNFTVKVTDAKKQTATQALIITVGN